jgi:hypothetical protein
LPLTLERTPASFPTLTHGCHRSVEVVCYDTESPAVHVVGPTEACPNQVVLVQPHSDMLRPDLSARITLLRPSICQCSHNHHIIFSLTNLHERAPNHPRFQPLVSDPRRTVAAGRYWQGRRLAGACRSRSRETTDDILSLRAYMCVGHGW